MASEKKFSTVEAFLLLPVTAAMMALMLVITIPLSLWSAWIRVKLWEWFAVPFLHLPHVGVWPMFGISLLVSTFQSASAPDKNKQDVWKALFAALCAESLLLGIGYCVHIWFAKG